MYISINSNTIVFGTDSVSQDDVIQRTDISSVTQNFVPAGLPSAARPGNRPQTCQVVITLNSKRRIVFDLADISNPQASWTLTKAGLNAFVTAILN